MLPDRDVLILGGGVAGLALARQLVRTAPGIRVAVVDPGPLPVDPDTLKVGESTSEVAAWYLDERLGLQDHLRTDQVLKLGLRFWFGDGTPRPLHDRTEWGLMTPRPGDYGVPFHGLNPPTFQLHRGRLEHHLATTTPEVTLWGGTAVTDVRPGAPHAVALAGPDGERTVTATWLVDASGGALRDRLGLDRRTGHTVRAAWMWVPGRLDPDTWSNDPALAARTPRDLRWRSTNHLVGPGYWVWLIPLASGATSVGVVADPQTATADDLADPAAVRAFLATREPELAAALTAPPIAFRHRLVHAHCVDRILSEARWAITGDAAAFVDPLYSPGLDFTALANELITATIVADRAGEPPDRRVRWANLLHQRFYDQFLPIYRGRYGLLGHPRVMAAKVGWDIAIYFGYVAPLVRSGRVGDLGLLARLGTVSDRVVRLQERIQELLAAWAAAGTRPVAPGRFVDQSHTAFLVRMYHALRENPDDEGLRALLTDNLATLEGLAVLIFRTAATEVGLTPPLAANPYAIGLDPARWAADGLESPRHAVRPSAELEADAAPIWLG